MIGADTETDLLAFFKVRGIEFNEPQSSAQFEGISHIFSEEVDDGESVIAYHDEVRWSDWLDVQTLVHRTLGNRGRFAVDDVHAWTSVGVPSDFEGATLGPPILRQPPKGRNRILGMFKRQAATDDLVNKCIFDYGGPYENLTIGSLPRILAELEECAKLQSLPLSGPEFDAKLFEACQDDLTSTTFFLLISIHFIRIALDRGMLVWWIK